MQTNEMATILVVDDIKSNIEVAVGYLKNQNYQFKKATSGQEALDIINTEPVDLILLDIMMPMIDGFEVCKRIRENDNFKDIPIIFITARTKIEDIVKGFQIGGNDYIAKPYQRDELIVRVRNHVELKLAKDLIKRHLNELKEANRFILGVLHQYSKYVEKERVPESPEN
jgi:CheY-like chemotaxis protein